jgi:hypothetical protein
LEYVDQAEVRLTQAMVVKRFKFLNTIVSSKH